MEFLLALIVIIVLLKILGVSTVYIIAGGLVLIGLAIVGMALLFIYCIVRLSFSKRKIARFVRIDTPENSRFKVAYYSLDGQEYPCFFPSEMILNDQMYRKDRTYRVMFNKRMGKVFDVWSIITCILGLIFSVSAVAAMFWLVTGVFGIQLY